ncbi:hypothetical protein GCM10012275_18960 [Longimycelium tulufanense]|uniref:Uncharacterized protein n=1 Tax=Longimycelium tulufanense TaxID=907463 RepID=A0A8J3CCN4_9PSEU|nr:hypothetical protein [Longimycelium tulufanense]GGM48117.1 hypothetical protein GCM10012275_18960 [Longimycelium tulufanense]
MAHNRNPAIDQWFHGHQFDQDRHLLLDLDQLTGLIIASNRAPAPDLTDDVLTAWYQELARHRRVLAQSEAAFIDQARRHGWSWQRIADALWLPNADAAHHRRSTLADELARVHQDGGWPGGPQSTGQDDE